MPVAKLMVKGPVSGKMDVGAWVSGSMDSCLGWGACFSKMEASTLVSYDLASGDKVSVCCMTWYINYQ
jgi:hypothetical protein